MIIVSYVTVSFVSPVSTNCFERWPFREKYDFFFRDTHAHLLIKISAVVCDGFCVLVLISEFVFGKFTHGRLDGFDV